MSKKLLSAALAIVMLFSVLAISVSALPASNCAGIKVTTDAKLGMPAGTTVHVKAYWTIPADAGEDYRATLSPIVIAIQTGYLTYADTTTPANGREWGSSYSSFLSPTSAITYSTAASGAWKAISTAATYTQEDKDKGYDACVMVGQSFIIGNAEGYTGTTGYPVDTDCPIFTLTFTTAKEIDENFYVGIPTNTAGKQTALKYATGGKSYTYAAANTDIREGAISAPFVYNYATQVQWVEGNSAQSMMNVGFRGLISGVFAKNGTGETVTTGGIANISKVGVLFSKTDTDLQEGEGTDVEATLIYNAADGNYYYRAVVGNIAYDSAETLYYRAYVVIDGTTYYAPTTDVTSGAAQYARAITNGMAAFAG